jgi:hypothetical protein
MALRYQEERQQRAAADAAWRARPAPKAPRAVDRIDSSGAEIPADEVTID